MKKRTKKEQRIVAVLKAIEAVKILSLNPEFGSEVYYLHLKNELKELLAYLKKS